MAGGAAIAGLSKKYRNSINVIALCYTKENILYGGRKEKAHILCRMLEIVLILLFSCISFINLYNDFILSIL